MFKKLVCLVIVIAFGSTVQALEFYDDFDRAMTDNWDRIDYQGWYEQNVLQVFAGYPATYPGGPWVIGDWDGYMSIPAGDPSISPTLIAYNYVDMFNQNNGEGDPPAWTPGYEGEVANGVLRIHASNGAWENDRTSGAFLFMMVEGDFLAEVEVVARDYWWHNMGGLMARKPYDPIDVGGKLSSVNGGGLSENWTQICHFPLWGQGNRVNDTVLGVTSWPATTGYPTDPHMRLERVGNTFYYYVSPDGITWTSLIPAGIVRNDLDGMVQVGIFQSNFTGDWHTNMDFDNFSIVPEPATIALLGLGGLVLLRRRK
jgi:hypothetical protein